MLHGVELVPVALGGGVGGLFGWRVLKSRVLHSMYDNSPIGMSRQEFGRRQQRTADRKSIFRVVLCAGAGMLVAWAVSSLLS